MDISQQLRQLPQARPNERNVNYGVYALRENYAITMTKSLLMVAGSLAAAALISNIFTGEKKQGLIETGNLPDVIYSIPVEIPHPAPSPASGQPEPAAKLSSLSGSMTIVDTRSTTATAPDLSAVAVNDGLQGGDAATSSSVTGATGESSAPATATSQVQEAYMVDRMPEFDGGLQALYRFISSHITYPQVAKEEEKEGTVHLRFVVNADGSISDISLLNRAGYGMDEEAARVVGMLPRFKTPGMAKGVAVKVYYTLPIRFKIR